MTETFRPCGSPPRTDFESQYRRIFEAVGCRTQEELAAVLGIRQSSVSDAKRRGAIPSDWLITLLAAKRINPEWVRTGVGGKIFQASDAQGRNAPVFVTRIERRPPLECTTDELVAEIVRRALREMG